MVLLIFIGASLSCENCSQVELAGKQPLLLEFDYVAGYPPVTSADGKTLVDVLNQVDFDLTVETQLPDDAPVHECVTESVIHHLMDETPDLSADWYAHGLVVPDCCDSNSGSFCGFKGALWFQNPSDPTRRDFVLFRQRFESNAGRFRMAVHELGHVLNTHHCEYGLKDYELAEATKRHLRDHRATNPDYIRPGSDRKWCEELLPSHEALHLDCEGSSDDSSACPGGDGACSSGGACSTILEVERAPRPRNVELIVELDQLRYIVGEPFRVNVVLKPGSLDPSVDQAEFLSERSLNPRLGFLRIWFREWGSSAEFRPMQSIMYAETNLKPQKLDKEYRSFGYDVWYSVPLPTSHDLAKDVEVMATYAGFPEGAQNEGDPIRLSNLVAVSEPVRIRMVPPTRRVDQDAYNLITHPEARLFLLLQGGDHLKEGRKILERVADGDSVYAKYADHALGASWLMPFLSFDRNLGTYSTRDPDFERARLHLDDLDVVGTSGGPRVLPPSYQRTVAQMRDLLPAP